MIEQLELYDYFDKVVWNKPLRLCELYGGIGSQHKALTNLGINISEHYLVEVDINATISYAAIHCDLNNHLEDEVPSDSDMVEYLRQFNFWSNEKPYDVAKLPKAKLKTLYLAQQLSNNLGDVYQLDDLPPVDLITWSTPCQDFSNAGLRKGFDGAKGGLTFITLELFRKLSYKPTFLLFENVPMIVSDLFRDGFNRMLQELNELGYENIVMKLNAKDYGIPQNRDRVFVLSIRKDYHANYSTPKPMPLELRLKDMLQDEVDERFYLSEKMLEYMNGVSGGGGFNRAERFNPHDETSEYAYAITTNAGNRVTDNFFISKPAKSRDFDGLKDISPTLCARDYKDPNWVYIKEATKKGYAEAYEGDGVYISMTDQKRGVVQRNMIPTIKTTQDVGVVVAGGFQPKDRNYNKKNNPREVQFEIRKDEVSNTVTTNGDKNMLQEKLRIRKLTPRETWRLMGFDDTDFDKASAIHSNSTLYKQAGNSIVVNVLEHILRGLFYESTTI